MVVVNTSRCREESLGVNLPDPLLQSPLSSKKGQKRLGRCYRCGQEGHFSKSRSLPARQRYTGSVRRWVFMQVYARRNPAMIQQSETSPVVGGESLEIQNMKKKLSGRGVHRGWRVSGQFHSERLWKRFKPPRLFVSLVLDHMGFKAKSDTGAVYPTYMQCPLWIAD